MWWTIISHGPVHSENGMSEHRGSKHHSVWLFQGSAFSSQRFICVKSGQWSMIQRDVLQPTSRRGLIPFSRDQTDWNMSHQSSIANFFCDIPLQCGCYIVDLYEAQHFLPDFRADPVTPPSIGSNELCIDMQLLGWNNLFFETIGGCLVLNLRRQDKIHLAPAYGESTRIHQHAHLWR